MDNLTVFIKIKSCTKFLLYTYIAVTLFVQINIMISEVYAGRNINSYASPANRFMASCKGKKANL